jgi:hypothetical protein
MNKTVQKLLKKRHGLLQRITSLTLLLHGSYLERYSTCVRPTCACHDGEKHGPRSYIVLSRQNRQSQVYVPKDQRDLIRKGIKQYETLLAIVKDITDINLQLMREDLLRASSITKDGGRDE